MTQHYKILDDPRRFPGNIPAWRMAERQASAAFKKIGVRAVYMDNVNKQ
jgi:hypothetical protein